MSPALAGGFLTTAPPGKSNDLILYLFLQIMIYLIDKVLPESYFVNNLRALSVDMAVFRDLLRLKLPELSQHLDTLQKTANKESGGSDDTLLFYL